MISKRNYFWSTKLPFFEQSGPLNIEWLSLFSKGSMQRQKLRELKGIDGSMLGDVAAMFCCAFCVIAQMGQELKGHAPGDQYMAREWPRDSWIFWT